MTATVRDLGPYLALVRVGRFRAEVGVLLIRLDA